MAENAHLENGSMEMHDMENGRKYRYWKMEENAHPENGIMENAQHGKWQKINILEYCRK